MRVLVGSGGAAVFSSELHDDYAVGAQLAHVVLDLGPYCLGRFPGSVTVYFLADIRADPAKRPEACMTQQ